MELLAMRRECDQSDSSSEISGDFLGHHNGADRMAAHRKLDRRRDDLGEAGFRKVCNPTLFRRRRRSL